VSSVDEAIAREARERREAQAQLTLVFKGSGRVELAERGDGLTLTASFGSLDEIQQLLQRFEQQGLVSKPS
jgi:NNP family nitrate/nitrite transporter-like MFS transporter